MNFQQRMSLIMGALGVAIGAFGAHTLHPVVAANQKVDIWNTALHYYWIHTLALFVIAFDCKPTPVTKTVSGIWIFAILLFSGSLIALAIGAPSIVGAITPIGGLGFIAGWLWLLRLSKSDFR